jgi:hypothetical protein
MLALRSLRQLSVCVLLMCCASGCGGGIHRYHEAGLINHVRHQNPRMLTFNVYDRVFFVRGERYGTAFSLDVDRRQYLISASHVVGNPETSALKLHINQQWINLPTTVVGVGLGEVDITVLAPSKRLSEDIELEPSLALMLGRRCLLRRLSAKDARQCWRAHVRSAHALR